MRARIEEVCSIAHGAALTAVNDRPVAAISRAWPPVQGAVSLTGTGATDEGIVSYLAHVHEQQRLTVRSNRVAPRRVQGACRVSAGVYYCSGRRERSDRDTAAASAMMSADPQCA